VQKGSETRAKRIGGKKFAAIASDVVQEAPLHNENAEDAHREKQKEVISQSEKGTSDQS